MDVYHLGNRQAFNVGAEEKVTFFMLLETWNQYFIQTITNSFGIRVTEFESFFFDVSAFQKLGLDCANWTEPIYLDLVRCDSCKIVDKM